LLIAQGRLSDARKAYNAAFAIARRLAETDRDNATRQHDLSLGYYKLAHLERRAGAVSSAQLAQRQALKIMDHVLRMSPDNAVWQRQFEAMQRELR
jgi:hypothetical protein